MAAKVAERMEVEIVFTENHRSDKDCEGRLRGKTARNDCGGLDGKMLRYGSDLPQRLSSEQANEVRP